MFTVHCPLLTADCGLPTVDCRLWTAYCGLPTADCRLLTADCGLPTADCRLLTADCGLPTVLLHFYLFLLISVFYFNVFVYYNNTLFIIHVFYSSLFPPCDPTSGKYFKEISKPPRPELTFANDEILIS